MVLRCDQKQMDWVEIRGGVVLRCDQKQMDWVEIRGGVVLRQV